MIATGRTDQQKKQGLVKQGPTLLAGPREVDKSSAKAHGLHGPIGAVAGAASDGPAAVGGSASAAAGLAWRRRGGPRVKHVTGAHPSEPRDPDSPVVTKAGKYWISKHGHVLSYEAGVTRRVTKGKHMGWFSFWCPWTSTMYVLHSEPSKHLPRKQNPWVFQ